MKSIGEAREKGNEETLEKLYFVLDANKIKYDKNKHKLLTRYFLLRY